MDLSVIVCTYNRATSLGHTLRALDGQVTPPDLTWELLVVDNNSWDGTRDVLGAFRAATRLRVRYIFEPRQGLSHARNAGVARAEGAIVAFTDDDAQPERDWVAGVRAVLTETGADVVGGRILPVWERPRPAWLESRPHLRGPFAIMEHPTPGPIVEARGNPNVWGANMAFRREVFTRVGSFDPGLGVTGQKLYRGEEVDLVQRALGAGRQVVYEPRLVVWHRIPASRMRRRYVARFYFEQAEGDALAQGAPTGRQVLGVPLYMYRAAIDRMARWLWAAVRRRSDALDRWLRACEAVGGVWGLWKRRFRGRTL